MSEFKFSCPSCGQKMFAEDQYAGMQITCPACQNEIVVPQQLQSISVRPTIRVEAVGVASPKAIAPPPSIASVAPPVRPAYMPKNSGPEKSRTKLIVTVVVIFFVVLCPIIFFFAFPDQVNSLEHKFGFAGTKVDPDAGGGQLGHIAELYSVLDATDPDKGWEEAQKEKAVLKKKMEEADRAAEQAEKDAALAEANTPLGEISWNLKPTAENVPTGKPHGSVSGTNFVADVVRLDNQDNQYLLTLQQGTNSVADCELQIYLQLKPDERIEGKMWTISPSQKTGAPRIIKKWKANPKFAPLQKVYGGGYAMLLEFGESNMGRIPATIYVALPDAEKSYVGGEFKVGKKWERFKFRDADDL